MKKFKFLVVLFLAVFVLAGCNANQYSKNNTQPNQNQTAQEILEVDDEGNTRFNNQYLQLLLNSANAAELSEEEQAGIAFMLEEEKLARDVYQKLYEKWGQQAFDNISESEETHKDAVMVLAEKYGIDTSFYNDEVGAFNNADLQNLYNDLTKNGEVSLVEALKIGALIEEIDILDLEEYMADTENEDLLLVYDNLVRGSRNHLRAYVRNMNRQGHTYQVQKMEKEKYQNIIDSENERGNQSMMQGTGQGQGQNQGPGAGDAPRQGQGPGMGNR